MIAVGRIERHFGVDARHDLEHGAHGINDLALRLDAAAGQIDHFGVGEFGALGAGSFESAHALDHQRRDRQQRNNDQPGADAENRLVAPRFAADAWTSLGKALGRLS